MTKCNLYIQGLDLKCKNKKLLYIKKFLHKPYKYTPYTKHKELFLEIGKKADFQFYSIFLFQTSTKTKIITFIVTQEKKKISNDCHQPSFYSVRMNLEQKCDSYWHSTWMCVRIHLAHTLLHVRALNVKSYEKFVQLVQDAEFDILFSSPCQTQTILFLVIWCWVFCKLAKIVKISLVTRQSMAYIFILILYFRNLQTIYYQCKIGISSYIDRYYHLNCTFI